MRASGIAAVILRARLTSASRGGGPRDPERFREDFRALLELLCEGKIHPVVAERLPLADAEALSVSSAVTRARAREARHPTPPRRSKRVGAWSRDAWRAALRVFEHAYGRAPEQPVDDVGLPDNPDDVAKLSWEQLKILAVRHADEGDLRQRASA